MNNNAETMADKEDRNAGTFKIVVSNPSLRTN